MVNIKTAILLSMLTLSITVNASEERWYAGGGLSNVDIDGETSVNYSLITGYDFNQWDFKSTTLQSLRLSLEAQYSDSINGGSNTKHYSVFAALRGFTSDSLFFKLKQGVTKFPDVILNRMNAESSHFGIGIGAGYLLSTGSIEIEYIRPNKTIDAGLFEVSYRVHF